MNTLDKALTDFNKAQDAHNKAHTAERDAREKSEAARRTVHEAQEKAQANGVSFVTYIKQDTPEKQAYEAAKNAWNDAQAKEKETRAVYYAASMNVAYAAANTLRHAMIDAPEKFNMPTHYKKFTENVKSVLGDRFYIDDMHSVVYVDFIDGQYGRNSAWVCGKNPDGTCHLMTDGTDDRDIVDLATIRREVKKAQKITAKIRKKYDALYNEYEAAKNELSSDIRYWMPDMEHYMKDGDLF